MTASKPAHCSSEKLAVYGPPAASSSTSLLQNLRMYAAATLISYGFHMSIMLFYGGLYLSYNDSTRILGISIVAVCLAAVYFPTERFRIDKSLRRGRFMRDFTAFFNTTCVVEEPLCGHPERQYLLAHFPHGTWPVGPLVFAYFVDCILPDQPMYTGVATALFYIPFFSIFFTRIGAVPASKSCVREVAKRGASMSLVVGGVAEMFLTNDEEEVVYMRTGFIREAIINGFSIAPVFHFGNSRIFHHVRIPLLDPALEFMSRRLYVPLIIYTGPFGLPIPHRTPIKTVVGTPFEVKQHDEPEEEEVQRLHDRFKAELQRIYEQHRPEWENRPLRIVEGR